MRYLAVMISSPGHEISATNLAGRRAEGFAAQPLLDERAVAEYRLRIRQLQQQMEEGAGDTAARDAAEREYDALVDQLMRSRGLGGRGRSFTGSDERARTSVQKAIKRAVARIRDADPVIADVIEHHVVTGYVCCYRP